MKAFYSPHFQRSLVRFTREIQQKLEKQIVYLLTDLHHPSLHAKKHDKSRGVWQARVDRSIRFYFLIEDDIYYLIDITHHSK